MNYVIINGKKSTLIKGLLISELPPIMKPQMRTSLEEIDGRDGDIVNKQGYKAYNKTMKIGLFGDFDIDQVIEYFNQSGIVIFSNEPDKYYYFDQISGIEFERLIRFKTAKVAFHVQPFKFSAVEDWFPLKKDKMTIKPSTHTVSNVTVASLNGKITVSGTSSDVGSVYIQINEMELGAEAYTLSAACVGTGATNCKVRVIVEDPSDADSFGGTYLQLDASASLSDTPAESKTYHYVWLEFESGATMDFELDLEMLQDAFTSGRVFNRGNIESKPKLTIRGSGEIELSVNGVALFDISLGSEGYITIDAQTMNAYKGDDLKNRLVSGDYSKLLLPIGASLISWTGTVNEIDIENVSRWI
jgi:predicted phage tail component-like protein